MSIAVMTKVWKYSQQKQSALLILLALADFANDDGWCWPSIDTLSNKARCSRRTVQETLRRLEKNGEIEVHLNQGRSGTNLYQVTIDVGDAETAPPISTIKRNTKNRKKGMQNSDANLRPNHQEPLIKPSLKDSRSNDRGKSKKKRDPLLDHPAIIEYRDVTRLHVLISWRKQVAETVGEDPEEVKRWRAVVHDWIGRGWNKQNVKGMLEVFCNPDIKPEHAYRKVGA